MSVRQNVFRQSVFRQSVFRQNVWPPQKLVQLFSEGQCVLVQVEIKEKFIIKYRTYRTYDFQYTTSQLSAAILQGGGVNTIVKTIANWNERTKQSNKTDR